ncbi:MAG: peptide chain release factor N(5)-glutamine methyltransferase, partial [Spirochaetota bacterium]|nr:peptide chain release factor N(5)-glutamine methyltransferase [Spirochaetota bacterium]
MYNSYFEIGKAGKEILKGRPVRSATLEVTILMSVSCDVSKEKLLVIESDTPRYLHKKRFFSFLQRRYSGEPVAYITETKEFYSIPFYVNRNVLIPRPETELIIDYILANKINFVKMLDLCTGSGCIPTTLNANISSTETLYGSDISSAALKVAEKNKRIKTGSGDTYYIRSDMLDDIHLKCVDVISCNPPYIDNSELKALNKDIIAFEPRMALDGGINGLYFYKQLARDSKKILSDNGLIIIEIGFNQFQIVITLFSLYGFSLLYSSKDYMGFDRVLVFK